MVHIFILKIKGCKNTKYYILYANVNKTTKYSARRDRDNAPKEKYLKLIEFRHFERHILFSQIERKDKKKAISSGVNVQVVVRV